MSTEEERRQQRIARLLQQLEVAGAAWAEAEYQEGIDTGHHGVVRTALKKQRDKAEQSVKNIMVRLGHTTSGQTASEPLDVKKAKPGERILRPNRAAGGRATAEKRKEKR
jgi:hypothetical protein